MTVLGVDMSWKGAAVGLLAAVVVGLVPAARAQSGPTGMSAAWDSALLQVAQFEGSITRVTVDLVVEAPLPGHGLFPQT